MNESVLYALAEVSVSLAGFSSVVVAYRLQGAQAWSPTELRVLWLLTEFARKIRKFLLLKQIVWHCRERMVNEE
jgi:hypothetical protein